MSYQLLHIARKELEKTHIRPCLDLIQEFYNSLDNSDMKWESIFTKFFLLQAKYEKLNVQQIEGRITLEQYLSSFNQISRNILECISDMEYLYHQPGGTREKSDVVKLKVGTEEGIILDFEGSLESLEHEEIVKLLGAIRVKIEERTGEKSYLRLEKIEEGSIKLTLKMPKKELIILQDLIRESKLNELGLLGFEMPHTGKIQIIPIRIKKENQPTPNIMFVQAKAAAGYLNGYADPEYTRELPKFNLPSLTEGTYRAFEIKGDSMLPLKSGTIIIGEYVEYWTEIKEGETYILVSTTEGVVYKRIYSKAVKDRGILFTLMSDNPAYPPYEVRIEEVREIWKAKMFISQELPNPDISLEKLSSILLDLQQEVIRLKRPESN